MTLENHPGTVYIIHQNSVSNNITTQLLKTAQIESCIFDTPHDLLNHLPLASPSCLLINYTLPMINGPQLITELRNRNVFQPAIIMDIQTDPDKLIHCMNHGAASFIKRPFQTSILLESIQKCITIDRKRAQAIQIANHFIQARAGLSRRENVVLDLLTQNFTSREAGDQLGISYRTIENHRAKIFKKLNITNSADLIKQSTIAETVFTILRVSS